jgi:predicted nucleotidyltransferase
MAKVPAEIIELVKKYVSMLEENNFPIRKAILFGSYVNGKYDKWSDIDVALVSDKFEGNRFLDRNKISRLTLNFDYNISPLPYNTMDFEEGDLFIKEILDNGIRIV